MCIQLPWWVIPVPKELIEYLRRPQEELKCFQFVLCDGQPNALVLFNIY